MNTAPSIVLRRNRGAAGPGLRAPHAPCAAGAFLFRGVLCDTRRSAAARFLAFLLVCSFARAETKVGDVFPPLSAAGLTPIGPTPAPDPAGKVVLVDFWASWCAPCKASFPMMAQLHKEFASRGFVIAAIGVDEKTSAAEAFAKKLSPPFATLHDREQKLVNRVVVPAMPTSYLVDRNGRVRFIHRGFHGETTARELRKQIESLLAEKT